VRYLFALLLTLFLSCEANADCDVKGTVQDCKLNLSWKWDGDPATLDGFLARRQTPTGWVDAITNIPPADRYAFELFPNDPGGVQQCYQVFAFNADGLSDPSNTACATSPIIDVVTMKTQGIVTVSHRAQDTSSIIAILVNQNTVIGAGGLELTYPPNYTLTVSRRASNTSSVIAILVNKSTNVLLNP
jgi:hypothetical protein